MWKIRNIKVHNQVGLAPMAGVSNASYMKICENMGVGFAVTELISSEAIVRDNKKTFDMLKGIENLNIPVGIQIFGSDAKTMAKAAQIINNLYKNAFIDINMGCPVPKVAVRAQSGSALLKDLGKIKEIVSSVVNAVPVPVTVKIRSGWDNENINAVEVAKICEESGASAICIHPRTRSQGYSGHSNWDIIKQVKENIKIPVIGNGDIKDIYDAKRMLKETNCDAIMIGRGVIGNPWLIKEINFYLNKGIVLDKPTDIEKIDMAIKHLENLREYKTEKIAMLEIRNHISWYLKGLKGAGEIKNKIYKSENISDIMYLLETYKKEFQEE